MDGYTSNIDPRLRVLSADEYARLEAEAVERLRAAGPVEPWFKAAARNGAERWWREHRLEGK